MDAFKRMLWSEIFWYDLVRGKASDEEGLKIDTPDGEGIVRREVVDGVERFIVTDPPGLVERSRAMQEQHLGRRAQDQADRTGRPVPVQPLPESD